MFKIGENVMLEVIFGEKKEAVVLDIDNSMSTLFYEVMTLDGQRYNCSENCLSKIDGMHFDPPGKPGPTGKIKIMKTWEALECLGKGEKIRNLNWKEGMYIKDDGFGNFIDKEEEYYVLENINGYWEIYEEPKNKCKDCAYRFKLQTGDIMCCKKAIDIEDDMHCKEFEYNEPSDDYVKAINALVKAIKESE